MAVILVIRALVRVLLGPLQVVSGLTDPADRWPEVLGFPVWAASVLLAIRLDLCVEAAILMTFALTGCVVGVLHLCGYRARDL